MNKNGKNKNNRPMVFPGQKKSNVSEKEKLLNAFRLPKCLESFESCVEDMNGVLEGREGMVIFIY